MSAPTIQRAPAQVYQGVQAAPAPQVQANVATQKAEVAFQLIKKITDMEVSAYSARAKSNAPQNAPGLIPVPLHDNQSGKISYISVNSGNILKFAAPAQLQKIEAFDAAKRKIFIEVLAATLNKLTGVQTSIICACEPTLGDQLANSKLIRAIVIQAAGL